MEISNLVNYYNTLLNTEIAVFGIISAVILVFIQLVYTNYSYKNISEVIKNKYIISFFVSSILDLLLTSAGSYFLSVNPHNLIPFIDFNSNSIVSNQIYALFCLVLIFISIYFFVVLIAKNITNLQPRKAILFLLKNTSYDSIRDFIWKKYGLEPPYHLKFRIKFINYSLSKKEKKEEKEKDEKEEQEADKKLHEIEEKIKKIEKKASNAEDPFLPLVDLSIQFIKKSDISSLSESMELWNSLSVKFIEKTGDIKNQNKEWSPEDKLTLNFTQHILDEISTLVEISDKESFESGMKSVIQKTSNYGLALLKQKEFDSLEKVISFWKLLADKHMKKYPSVFKEIIKYHEDLANYIYDSIDKEIGKEEESENRILNKIYESLGQIGEKFLSSIPIQKTSRFMNYDYSSEYDDFMNIILSMGRSIEENLAGSYPLTFFYTVRVIGEQIAEIYVKNKEEKLSNNIFDIAFIYSSFARNAVKKENSSGVALACSDLFFYYESVKKLKLDKEANEIIKLLVDIGMDSAGNKDKLKQVEFIEKPIDEWIIDKLASSGEDLDREIMDSYIKFNHGDSKNVQKFITDLSNRTGSKYGLDFSKNT